MSISEDTAAEVAIKLRARAAARSQLEKTSSSATTFLAIVEEYVRATDAFESAIEQARAEIGLDDDGDGEVLVYKAKDGYRWHAQALNGRYVAESGEAFTRKAGAMKSAEDYAPAGWDVRYIGEADYGLAPATVGGDGDGSGDGSADDG